MNADIATGAITADKISTAGAFTLCSAIFKNGAVKKQVTQLINYGASFTQTMQVNAIVYFNGTTDYAGCHIQTNSGTVTATAGSSVTHFSGHYLRP